MGKQVIHEDMDKYYKYQPPKPRSKWNASKPWSAGSDMKFKRDYTKCFICGGTGYAWSEISPGRKRLYPCPKCAVQDGI